MGGRGYEDSPAGRVRARADEFFDAVADLVGERLAERRFDDDDHLRVTVIELSESDREAILDAARRIGIDGWVRLERADPAALAAGERVRRDLLDLQDAQPDALWMYPTPAPGYRRPPFEIALNPNAEDDAAHLHSKHGAFVRLIVGALEYPTRQPEYDPGADSAALPMDPRQMRVELDGPLTVKSGHTVTHGLLLTNLSAEPIEVRTNGQLTAAVLDPVTGATVGGYSGSQHLPAVGFRADPSGTVRIPLLVGTASFVPDLGYTIPPGNWRVAVDLVLQDGRRLRTPSVAFKITD